MKTVCPHCQQVYDVEDRFENMALQCNSCSQVFTAVRVEEQASETNVLPKWWDKLKKKFKEKFFVETICPHCMQFYELPGRKLNTSVTCSNCDNDFVVEEIITCPNCQNICRESETICSVCETNLDVCKSHQNLTGWKKILNYKVDFLSPFALTSVLLKAVCKKMEDREQEKETDTFVILTILCVLDSLLYWLFSGAKMIHRTILLVNFILIVCATLLKAVRKNVEDRGQKEETANWKKVLFWPFAILTIFFVTYTPWWVLEYILSAEITGSKILLVGFILIVCATLPLTLIYIGQGLSCNLTKKFFKLPYYFSALVSWVLVGLFMAGGRGLNLFLLLILVYSFIFTYSGVGRRQIYKIQAFAFIITFTIVSSIFTIYKMDNLTAILLGMVFFMAVMLMLFIIIRYRSNKGDF